MHQAENSAGALGQTPVVDGHQAQLRARRAGIGAASKKQALRQFHLEGTKAAIRKLSEPIKYKNSAAQI